METVCFNAIACQYLADENERSLIVKRIIKNERNRVISNMDRLEVLYLKLDDSDLCTDEHNERRYLLKFMCDYIQRAVKLKWVWESNFKTNF